MFFVSLVMMQLFGNLHATRLRHLSFFQQPPYKNPRLFLAMAVSISFAALFVYTPGIQSAIGTYPIPAEYWFIPIPFGVFILICDEIRKLIIRVYPQSVLARVAW